MKQEAIQEFSGYKARHTARVTGTVVSVVDGLLQGLDTSSGRWYTVCEQHNTLLSHGSLTLARGHSVDPQGWCEECRKIWDSKQQELLRRI